MPTREGLIRAYEQMRDKDLGGLKLSFAPDNHNGSRFVEITTIGREGKLVRGPCQNGAQEESP